MKILKIIHNLLIFVVLLSIFTGSFAATLTWQQINTVSVNSFSSFKNGTLLAMSVFGWSHAGVYQSKDNGATWQLSQTGIDDQGFLWNSAYDSTNDVSYIISYSDSTNSNQLYSSADQGTTWQNISSLFPEIFNIAGSGGQVYGTTLNNGVCLLNSTPLSCYQPQSVIPSGLYSTNGELYGDDIGGTIAKIDVVRQKDVDVTGDLCRQIDCGGDYVASELISIPNGSQDTLYLANNRGLWTTIYTPGMAVAWRDITPMVAGQRYSDVTALTMNGTQLIVGTQNEGVFISNDSGRTWSEAGLAGIAIQKLFINKNTLFAGTKAGIYSASLS